MVATHQHSSPRVPVYNICWSILDYNRHPCHVWLQHHNTSTRDFVHIPSLGGIYISSLASLTISVSCLSNSFDQLSSQTPIRNLHITTTQLVFPVCTVTLAIIDRNYRFVNSFMSHCFHITQAVIPYLPRNTHPNYTHNQNTFIFPICTVTLAFLTGIIVSSTPLCSIAFHIIHAVIPCLPRNTYSNYPTELHTQPQCSLYFLLTP